MITAKSATATLGTPASPTDTPPTTETPPTAPDVAAAAARVASQVAAARQVRHAATRWLTSDRVTQLGQQLVAAIDRYQQRHQSSPTWADALAGVDPALLEPIRAVPDDWPHRPAFWRRELRQHLMTELRRTQWISYSRTPRSLQPGNQGRGWLRTTHPTPAEPTTLHPTVDTTTAGPVLPPTRHQHQGN